MKKEMLTRYERDAEGRIIIDIASSRIEDFYSYFDRAAPFLKKDLDGEFVEYLISCVREIGPRPFAIRLDLEQLPDAPGQEKVVKSMDSYFLYMKEEETRRLKDSFRTSSIFFIMGFVILAAAIWIRRLFSGAGSVVGDVMSEGLTVAAWVALWEALANLLIQLKPLRRNISIYERLAKAQIAFNKVPGPSTADLFGDIHADPVTQYADVQMTGR